MSRPSNSKHGGRREGAGRKPMPGAIAKMYRLTEQHVGMLEQYRQRHGLATASAALRHLIENAERKGQR